MLDWARKHHRGITNAVDSAVVIGLVAAGFLLRRPGLAPASLFFDDAWVALVYRVPLSEVGTVDFTTTGFTALVKAWTLAVGFSELRLQMPIMAASLVTAPIIYWMLRRRIGRVLATTGAAFIVIAPNHVDYSVRIKQFTIEALAATVIIWATWRIIERPADRNRWAVLAGCSIFAMVTSFSTATTIAAAFAAVTAHVILRQRDQLRLALTASISMGVIGLGWFALIVRSSLSDQLHDFWAGQFIDTDNGRRALVKSFWSLSQELVNGYTYLPSWLVAALIVGSALVLLWTRTALLIVLLGPLVAAVLMSLVEVAPFGGGRTDIILYPGLTVLMVTGIHDSARALAGNVQSHPVRRGFAIALVPLLAVAALTQSALEIDRGADYPIEAISPLLNEMAEGWLPGDVVLAYYGTLYSYPLYLDVPFDVYSGPAPFGVVVDDPDAVFMSPHRVTPELYQQYIDQADLEGRRIWFLVSHPCICDVEIILQLIRDTRGADPTLDHRLEGAGLWRWD